MPGQAMRPVRPPLALGFAALRPGRTGPRPQPYPTAVPIRMVVPFTARAGPVDVAAPQSSASTCPHVSLGRAAIIENRAAAPRGRRSAAQDGSASADPRRVTRCCGETSARWSCLPAGDQQSATTIPAKVLTFRWQKVSQKSRGARRSRRPLGYGSVEELVAFAKANPGEAQLWLGRQRQTPRNLATRAVQACAPPTDIVHVPYKGAADAVTALLGGQVQMFIGDNRRPWLPFPAGGNLARAPPPVSSEAAQSDGAGRTNHGPRAACPTTRSRPISGSLRLRARRPGIVGAAQFRD